MKSQVQTLRSSPITSLQLLKHGDKNGCTTIQILTIQIPKIQILIILSDYALSRL